MNVYPLKCRIRAADGGVTRVDVYDDIGPGGWFADGVTASSFAGQLAGVKGALEVHISSGGGDVFDGIAIGNAIRAHKGPVTTVVDGLAASIASVIAQAGQERVMQPGSMMMIHDAWGACVGDAAEMAKMVETLDVVSDNIAGIYASRAGGDADQWRQVMKTEAWYSAEDAVEAGLADRVGDGTGELPAGLDLAAYALPGRIAAALRELPRAAAQQSCADLGHQCCQDAAAATEARLRQIVRDELRLANADKYKQADRDRMAKSGEAMPDGSYPIADEEDLDNAIRAVGRGGSDHDTIRAHIIKRAKALGLSEKIPDNWNADGSLKTGNHADPGFAWNPDQFRASLERKDK